MGTGLYLRRMGSALPSGRLQLAPPPPATPAGLKKILARPLPPGAEAHLAAFARRGDAANSLYVSTPITTGPRLLAWRRANPKGADSDPFGRELKREVIAENIRALGPLRTHIARGTKSARVIDPTELDEPGWSQADYHRFWIETISRFASTLVLADGWQYSTGCAYEFSAALLAGIPMLDSNLDPVNLGHAADLLRRASRELEHAGLPSEGARSALHVIQALGGGLATPWPADSGRLKDRVLADLASSYNVALFASFSPGEPVIRHFVSRTPDEAPRRLEEAVSRLLAESHEGSLNVRTFRTLESKSSPFVYGLKTEASVVETVRRLAAEGYYTIVNETIDIHDGGISGVRLGGIVEFAPDTTPRGVENADVVRMSVTLANELLTTIYGFPVEVPGSGRERIEFSIHPDRVGYRRSHLCVWEAETVREFEVEATPAWPNDFSRLIGDKSFGLLIAHLAGAPVPHTTVVSRRIAPFSFGERTSSGEWWVRTAPRQQEAGLFTTRRGWADPFDLLAREDPDRSRISAILAQEGVPATYSGATLPREAQDDIVEGVRGAGERFMLGEEPPTALPTEVVSAVRSTLGRLTTALGPVRIEWAFDGRTAWVLQLHRVGAEPPSTLSPGHASTWVEFEPKRGLAALRELVAGLSGSDTGVLVTGRVGVTSHVGDLLRKAGIPARFRPASD